MPDYRSVALYVRERYQEERAVAEAAAGGTSGAWTAEDLWRVTDDKGEPVVYDEGRPDEAQTEHIALQDPEHTLADLKGKLAIVEDFLAIDANERRHFDAHMEMCHTVQRDAMLRLAEAYERRPDFDHGWL